MPDFLKEAPRPVKRLTCTAGSPKLLGVSPSTASWHILGSSQRGEERLLTMVAHTENIPKGTLVSAVDS